MTKLTTDKIPDMTPKKPKKLGLLTTRKRKNITFRVQLSTIKKLEQLLLRSREVINNKISRTDILEALVWDAQQNRTNTDIRRFLLASGKRNPMEDDEEELVINTPEENKEI